MALRTSENTDLATAAAAKQTADAKEEEFRYFLFSKQQLDMRTNIEKTVGKRYVPGEVIIKGKPKLFTEMSKKPTNRFQDAKVVTKGYIGEIKYTEPYVV